MLNISNNCNNNNNNNNNIYDDDNKNNLRNLRVTKPKFTDQKFQENSANFLCAFLSGSVP